MGDKMKKLIAIFRVPARYPLILLCTLVWVSSIFGCAVSQTPKETKKSLVSEDSPIFDKRFDDLSFKDIDVKNLWVKGGYSKDRDSVQVNNNTIADIVDSVKDGVVNLYTRRLEVRDVKFGISPSDLLPMKIPFVSAILEVIPFQVPIPFKTEGFSLGSGFIINQEGYILTNAHVVNNATDIRVVLFEGKREYPAKIIGIDRLTDTALIKMEPDSQMKVLPLGNSDTLRTGEMVLAVGNPFGLKHTVTLGIVSAKERVSPQLNEEYVDFIQTDSAINPGSSGGPLLNLYGEVVGINTAIVAKAQSIGFAIPIDTTKEVMSMLVLGKTERGWFGAQVAPLSVEKAQELNYPDGGGILVIEVVPESPAEKTGLQPNDIIVELNGERLTNFFIFRRKLLGLAPEQEIHLTVIRDGKSIEMEGTLIKKRQVK
jgi:serine protease Do